VLKPSHERLFLWTGRTQGINLRNHPGPRRRGRRPEKKVQRGDPNLPQTLPSGEGGHGGLHQHRAPVQEADRRRIPGHRLPPEEDPVHSRGPHQVQPGRLEGPGGAAQAEQPTRELHVAQTNRVAQGEGAPQGLPSPRADEAQCEDQGRTHLRGSQASGWVRPLHLEGEGVARRAGAGVCQVLPQGDGDAERGDPQAQPGVQAHSGGG